jgi:ribosomal protein S18 acetylase RimI-like enzyme
LLTSTYLWKTSRTGLLIAVTVPHPTKNRYIGFLAIKQHNEFAAEIYVMAVHPQFHHRGVGRKLVEAAENELRELGVEYLQVKTLGSSSPDPNYRQTRKFYESVGFKPLEEFLNLWEGNPCLQMVKKLPAD